jgi:predicted unusual protein kinase regulating ubiquinone biosynthesis (AarF/ABC1/UbiB family)
MATPAKKPPKKRARKAAAPSSEPVPGQLTKRAIRIATVMARHGIKDFTRGDASDPDVERRRARSFRDALQELGPTFSKLGQILSTRPDLLPPAFVEELETLQEKVTPLTEEEVVRAIETSLGVPWEDAFESIEPEPLAAGTIAQVHRATLEDGDPVVVKVQRPDAATKITQDLELLKLFAEKTADRSSFRKMIDVPAMTEHLSEGLRRELDFTNEAKNIERMREILMPYTRLHVPKVYEQFTDARLLVMEDIRGLPLRQAPEGKERREAARQLLESYYRQVLAEGFFHADPHPGNLRWYRDSIYFLDFGMVGELDAGLRDALLLLVMALWQEDTPFVAEAILSLSDRDPDTVVDMDAFAADLDGILKKHRHLSLKEIELGPLLTELTTVSLRHEVRLPASMALTAKALAQMQLAAADLDPTLDPFGVAGQYLARHVLGQFRERVSPGKMLYEASKIQTRLGRLFSSFEGLMGGAKGGRLQVQFRGTERLEDSIRRAGRRLAISLVATGSLLGAAIASTSVRVPDWVSATGAGVGSAFALALIWDVVRRR